MTVAEIASRIDSPTSSDGADEPADADPGEPDLSDLEDVEALEPEKSIGDLLKEPLEGSIYDQDIGELWNPEEGAENRLLLVAEELGGIDGIPRAAHLAIAIAEILSKHSEDSSSESTSSDDPEDDEDEIDATTREVLEYEP